MRRSVSGSRSLRSSATCLHRDVANLRERMARLEGAADLLTKFPIDREAGRAAGGAAAGE